METYETFFARVTPWMAPSEIIRLQISYMMVKSSHRYQTRNEKDENGNPERYFVHPRRVAIYILDRLGLRDFAIIVEALFHDTLEDTRISAEMLEFLHGGDICRNTKLVSKLDNTPLSEDPAVKKVQKRQKLVAFFDRLTRFGTWRPKVVKLCDRIDNLRAMKEASPEFVEKQRLETIEFFFPLLSTLFTDPECPPGIAQILQEDLSAALSALSK